MEEDNTKNKNAKFLPAIKYHMQKLQELLPQGPETQDLAKLNSDIEALLNSELLKSVKALTDEEYISYLRDEN